MNGCEKVSTMAQSTAVVAGPSLAAKVDVALLTHTLTYTCHWQTYPTYSLPFRFG